MKEALFDHVAASYDSWYDTEVGAVSDQLERHLAQSMFKFLANRCTRRNRRMSILPAECSKEI
ncbi:hypothetical protein Desaci_2698 [Desulfosporosinus acidiphilus SJ4]|uniref:Uncharacterized protein n=1 Tax=Desulfosporosinus acidiphilus (strain DSM 22704 / JCM 16185 / SJ4) TaxID=646529 RepID=I4D756_DESAJ|nr:hypothetical protein Desaci_2698 [Desulfosporosinus acidiphilus SJ4]